MLEAALSSTDLTAIQESIEQQMADESVIRQRRDNEGSTKRNDWSGSKVGTFYVTRFLNQKDTEESTSYLTSIRKYLHEKPAGAKKMNIGAKLLLDTGIEIEQIALLGLKGIINALSLYRSTASRQMKRSTVCIRIADLVHDEWRVKVFQDTDYRKRLMAKLLRDFEKRAYPREWRRRTILNYFQSEQLEWSGWDKRQRCHVGYALLHLFKMTTGLIEYTDGGMHVEATEEFVQHINAMVSNQAPMFMLYRPMVVPPKPWGVSNLFKGGYRTKKVRPYPLVKGSRKRDLDRLMQCDLSKVFPAVNALQETPWRINREMLDALQWAYKTHGGGIGKLPLLDEEPFPPLPPNYETDPQVKRDHNYEVFMVRDRRRGDKSRRVAANMVLQMAEAFAQHDAIYFPHNLDSRGRAYPITGFLNPQGADYVKALLEFSRGETIGENERAGWWLAVAVANAYGNDKVSLQERVDWTHENQELILSIANDYRSDLRWMQTSEPFQFLRACLEWRDYQRHGKDHVTRMVIPVDATNSGLQHYSALLRDEHGGFYVNLIPGHSRQDIYGKVAEQAIEGLMEDGDEIARNLLSLGIDRKATKRQVMVVPYAGKFASCMGYTRKWIEEKLQTGIQCPWDKSDKEITQEHVKRLATHIWRSIGCTVIKGSEAMKWLGQVASEYSKTMNAKNLSIYERRMTWRTPDGFEVVHLREDQKEQRVSTTLDGTVRLSYFEDTGKLAPRDMALAVAPNFIHSLDANHLRATIILALDRGIRDFGMVHDSFGTHATRMGEFLSECVKPAFVSMYERDILEDFASQYRSVCKVKELPEKGGLDLSGVLQSEFFFS